MQKYSIPTAKYEVFDEPGRAIEYLKTLEAPYVIKAEGLALGKGVIIAKTLPEAERAVRSMMEEKLFGNAGNRIVIEEFLTGPEISVLAFTDGKTMRPMVSAQDHKRAYDNDEGPNTGGMGAFSPSRIYDEKMAEECMENIFLPTMRAMNSEGRTFKGVLYFGLMATKDGVKVIEYNCRFGDPETQVVLPRLNGDLYEIFDSIIDGRLDEAEFSWYDGGCVCVVAASGGYPVKYDKGYEITGIADAEAMENVKVFHAGTALKDGKIVTSGGRVLGVTARAESLDAAIKKAYEAVEKIRFEKMHYRRDIGIKKY